jgi:RND family efflux transporter MFP subunit
MKVAVGVPEMLISQVREGDKVQVAFDAVPGRKLAATVTEVGIAPSGAVTTFPVTVLLEGTQTDVRPGMAAEVAFSFPASDTRERFIVPPFAVGEDRDGRFLFVVNPGEDGLGTVERRAVAVGELTRDGLEVFSGLVEGDLLVTAGVTKLADGQRVRLPGTEGAAP